MPSSKARSLIVRPIEPDDHNWVKNILDEYWGSTRIISRGQIHNADNLPGFIALSDANESGLATYSIVGKKCELVTLNSLIENLGVGTAMIEAVKNEAITRKCTTLWLITTNDNTRALRFYQKRGFKLTAIYPDAIHKSRQLKPEIPLIGNNGIPIRDEIELEMIL